MTTPENRHGPLPYLKDGSELIIPCNTPKKYKWWAGGQSIKKTLEELGASEDVNRRYLDQKSGRKVGRE